MIEVPLLCLVLQLFVITPSQIHTVGLIYGGMETSGDDNGVIGVWNATDLTLVKYVFTTQNGFPW
jgi:hypothetical protein